MGEVYTARDARLGREVAFKLLHEEFARSADRRARFENEARAVAVLAHPNIVTVHDVGSESGVLYMVSELVRGELLRALMDRGPMPVRKAIDVAVQVADGLAAAHARGITHRDLKPENIMVTPEGLVKILDFGLARQAVPLQEDGATVSVQTQAGTILGTVNYMSPEQARGLQVDYRSDQFSLGLILFEMLAGKRAFQRDTTVQTLSAILTDEPPPIDRCKPGSCLSRPARLRGRC
jgi:serine/threonine protein kinase